MHFYAIAMVAVLAMILTGVLTARRRRKPTCPRCGARYGQQTIAEREISSRNVMFADREWFDIGHRTPERLKVRRHDVIDATMRCSKCGTQYERSRIAEKDVLG